jgi:hypothetical protein
MIHKYHKRKVYGKQNLDKVYVDALSLYNEDTREVLNIKIFEVDKHQYLPLLEAPEDSYVFVEKVEDVWVSRTESEYENFKFENIDLYI